MNANHTPDRQPSEQTTPRPQAQIDIKRTREQHRATRKRTARKVRRGEYTRGVVGIARGDVQEDALHQDKHTGRVDDDTNRRNDPVHLGPSGPAE